MNNVKITAAAHGIRNTDVVKPHAGSDNAIIGYQANGNYYELEHFAAGSEELFEVIHITVELDSEAAAEYSEEELEEIVRAEAEDLVTQLVSSDEELELEGLSGCRVEGDENHRNTFGGQNILLLDRVDVAEVKAHLDEQQDIDR